MLEIGYGVISYHLAKLRDARLVNAQRYMMYLYYELDTKALSQHREAARLV